MSDWGDDEPVTAGRSFGGEKKGYTQERDDDTWGDENGGKDDAYNGGGGDSSGYGGGRGRGGGGGGRREFSDRNGRENGGYSRGGAREGDWTCSGCNNSNFASRSECRNCSAPREDGGGSSGKPNGRGGGAREGDWKCPSCDNSNFASRSECRNCSAPREDGGGNSGKQNGRGGGTREGDWTCPSCDNSNFASRRECRNCQEPRADGGGNDKPSRGGGGGGGGAREGDWTCPSCDNSNFASRRECRNCQAPREDGGEDGGEQQKPREFYIPPEPTENEDELFGSGITSGINFTKYDNIPVKITGRNPPESIKSFEGAGLRDLVAENIRKSGYKKATPIQKASIPAVMAGRDLMGCAQTGSGKTAAYLLPIIHGLLDSSVDMMIGRPQALIVAPTRELAIQISNEARKFAHGSYLKVNIVYGGTSSKYQSESVSKGCHILIATPGRLLDFVDRAYITFEEIRYVVLDEADRMLDMGFKDSIDKIMSHATMRKQKDRQSLMFSATFPEDIQQLASAYLKDYIFVAIGIVGGACSDVKQVIMEVPKFEKRNKLLELLQESADGTIVFVETKRGADFLASLLSETEYPTTSIHGDRLQRQREEALRDLKSGRMKVLVATSVAARGLDIRNVKHVVNYDMPDSLDEYVHRIGRTGRVGNNGRSTSFFDPEKDAPMAAGLIKILENSGQDIPPFLQAYATGGGGNFKQSNFGGRDMRQGKGFSDKPQPLEAEEDWG